MLELTQAEWKQLKSKFSTSTKSSKVKLPIAFTEHEENTVINQTSALLDEVQQLVQQHYDWINNFWTPTKETYLNLAQLYLDHPDYRDFYNRYHPNLVNFVVEAIIYYAQHHLGVLK